MNKRSKRLGKGAEQQLAAAGSWLRTVERDHDWWWESTATQLCAAMQQCGPLGTLFRKRQKASPAGQGLQAGGLASSSVPWASGSAVTPLFPRLESGQNKVILRISDFISQRSGTALAC